MSTRIGYIITGVVILIIILMFMLWVMGIIKRPEGGDTYGESNGWMMMTGSNVV